MAIAGLTMRVISTGSRSTRISLRFASVPQRVCGWLSLVPIASTTSAVFHSSCPASKFCAR
jgi:hypothetical protein